MLQAKSELNSCMAALQGGNAVETKGDLRRVLLHLEYCVLSWASQCKREPCKGPLR